jgi:hypothetical protein
LSRQPNDQTNADRGADVTALRPGHMAMVTIPDQVAAVLNA